MMKILQMLEKAREDGLEEKPDSQNCNGNILIAFLMLKCYFLNARALQLLWFNSPYVEENVNNVFHQYVVRVLI